MSVSNIILYVTFHDIHNPKTKMPLCEGTAYLSSHIYMLAGWKAGRRVASPPVACLLVLCTQSDLRLANCMNHYGETT